MPSPQTAPGGTRRFLMILWAMVMLSVGLYFLITIVIKPQALEPDSMLVIPLLAVSVTIAAASVAVKMRYGATGEGHRPALKLRAAYILSFVLAETPALFGLVVFMLTGWPLYWIFFLISVAAYLLNFPRGEEFDALD